MKIYIKNMDCERYKPSVRIELDKLMIETIEISLREATKTKRLFSSDIAPIKIPY